MALTKVSIYDADATGSKETVSLQAVNTTISNAYYGLDGSGKSIPVDSVAADGMSLVFTVAKGQIPLTVNLVSTATSEGVMLYQDDPVKGELASFNVNYGSSSYFLYISGT